MSKKWSLLIVFIMFLFMLVPLDLAATCSPSKISLSPVSLNAITGSVDTVTTTTTIADDCGAPLTYTATVTGGSSWLTLPVSGKDSMTVTANIKGMAAGTYTGKATIKATGLTDAGLTVTLTIGTTCAATLDNTLKLKAPIIKYTDSASTKHYYWVDEVYTSDPSKVLFKVSALGAQGTTGYNCNMSWIDSDLIIYARDVLFGGSFYWLKLAYDTSLSDSSNYYFYAKNYGAGSMSGVDSNLYFGFSYGTTNTTNSVSSSTGSMPNGKAVSGPVSFEVLLTNGAASEAIGALGYLNSDYSFASITSGIFTKTTTDGKKVFQKISFGTDSLPATITDYSTGYTTTFSNYTNGTVHIKIVDSAGVVIISDKKINIEAEWFTYFSNQIVKASSAEKTLEAIGYAMGTIFDKITCAIAPETTAGNSACGGLIAAATTFGCDLTKTKDGICGYINVVPDGLAGAATLASCVANVTVTNTGSSVVDCTKEITAKVIEKAKVNFVKEITPGSGAVGTAVIITGSGFGTTKGTVTFNGITTTITSWSDIEIKTTVPTGATTGYVVVTAANGLASNGLMFTVDSAVSTVPYEDMTAYMTDEGKGWVKHREHIVVNDIYWMDSQKTIPKIDPKVTYPNYGRYSKFYKYTIPDKFLSSCTNGVGFFIGGNIDTPISENMIVSNRDFMTDENAWNLYLGNTGQNSDGTAGPGYNTLGYGLCREGTAKNGDCKNPTVSGSTMDTDIYTYSRKIQAVPVGADGQKIWHSFTPDYETESINVYHSSEAPNDKTFYAMIVCEDTTPNKRLYAECYFRFEVNCW